MSARPKFKSAQSAGNKNKKKQFLKKSKKRKSFRFPAM